MLIIISPAKTLDFDTRPVPALASQPAFLGQSATLMRLLVKYSPRELGQLMRLSPKLAELNVQRNLNWHAGANQQDAKPAVWVFKGDVYKGLQVDTFDAADLDYAQQHLRILSGLYGLLRPLDLIQPYRLEMGTKLNNPAGKDLYAFWGEQISQVLNQHLQSIKSEVLLNLASDEYSRAVSRPALQARVVSPVFKDWKNADYKLISFFAKRARGALSAWVIKNRVTEPHELAQFAQDGYRYSPQQSTDERPVFLRKR